jgi:hypothetical protein
LSHSEKIYDRPLSDRQKTVGDICFPAARWSAQGSLFQHYLLDYLPYQWRRSIPRKLTTRVCDIAASIPTFFNEVLF